MNISNRTRRVLWVAGSVIVATVFSTVLAMFVTQGVGGSGMGIAIVAAFVYLLPMTALQIPTESAIRRWADASRFPVNWIVYGGAKLVIGLATAAIGSSLMMLFGLVKRWQDLGLANRMVVVVTVLAACLIRLYSTTRQRLEERNRELEKKVEAESRTVRLHEQDFERAREIQEALMPKQLPQIRGCELAAGCKPARIVGGDYYDAIRLGDTSAAIVIGDVSGKGMGAALLMSNLQAIVRAFAPSGMPPDELCAKANQLISANVAPGKYITFFYAVADSALMRLEYCNAGHNPPMLRHVDGTVETLGEGGPVLGIFPGARYAAGAVDLKAGDCLLLFTDGITEAMNTRDEEFGDERLAELVNRSASSAEERRQEIMTAVTEFSNGAFHDDATLLVMAVN